MRRLGNRVAVCVLGAFLAVGGLPTSASADSRNDNSDARYQVRQMQQADAAGTITAISPQTDFTLGSHAVLVDNDKGGKALHINTSWESASSADPLTFSAAFKNTDCFRRAEFTLYMDVYRLENGAKAPSQAAGFQGRQILRKILPKTGRLAQWFFLIRRITFPVRRRCT